MQLVLHRLLTVASSCCDGVTVGLDVVEELVPPPQEAKRNVEKAMRIRVISFFMIYGADVYLRVPRPSIPKLLPLEK